MTIVLFARQSRWLPRFRFRRRGNLETWRHGQPVILLENEIAFVWLFTIIVRWYA